MKIVISMKTLACTILSLGILSLLSSRTFADDLEDLARDGFGVVEVTRVDGDYEGCDFNRQIPLMDGLIFQCSTYRYHYAFGPEVLILKSVKTGELKVMIAGDEMRGQLFRRQ